MLPYIIRFLPVIIIIIAICVIIFTLIYRKTYNTQGKVVFKNWYYYLIFGIMIICSVIIFYRFYYFSEKPGGNYIPPTYTDEGIVPGYVDR